MTVADELREVLEAYDGRHTEVLEAIRDAGPPTAGTLRAVIDLGADPDERIAAAATWLLRAWVEGGVGLSRAQIGRLARQLPLLAGSWARQHVCQTVRSLRVLATEAQVFAEFLEGCRTAKQPFLRAWAIDGLYRLGLQHPNFAGSAQRALEDGLEDAAASVRARVRRIQNGD